MPAPGTPEPSSAAARARMVRQGQAHTSPEVALRHELRRRGIGYRVDVTLPLKGVRRRADIAFIARRVAVFVDGCYWHVCPQHATWPKASAEWWRAKLEANVRRDRDTDARLADAGWTVVRVWEHESPAEAADRIADAIGRTGAAPRAPRPSRAGRPAGGPSARSARTR